MSSAISNADRVRIRLARPSARKRCEILLGENPSLDANALCHLYQGRYGKSLEWSLAKEMVGRFVIPMPEVTPTQEVPETPKKRPNVRERLEAFLREDPSLTVSGLARAYKAKYDKGLDLATAKRVLGARTPEARPCVSERLNQLLKGGNITTVATLKRTYKATYGKRLAHAAAQQAISAIAPKTGLIDILELVKKVGVRNAEAVLYAIEKLGHEDFKRLVGVLKR